MVLKDNLKMLRKACGFNQEAVAKVLGVDRSSYAYYESGKTEPSVENLIKLARIFRVSSDELIGNAEFSQQLALGNEPADGCDAGLHTEPELLSRCSAEESTLIAYFRVLENKKKVLELLENEYRLEQEKHGDE